MKIKLFLAAITFFTSTLYVSGTSLAELFDKEDTNATFTAGTWELAEEEQPPTQEPGVLLYANSSKTQVGFTANNVSGFDKLKYTISYVHKTEFGNIGELIIGEIDNSTHDNIVSKEWFRLGSCSSGGTCVDFSGIEKVYISLDLVSGGTVQKTINDTMAF